MPITKNTSIGRRSRHEYTQSLLFGRRFLTGIWSAMGAVVVGIRRQVTPSRRPMQPSEVKWPWPFITTISSTLLCLPFHSPNSRHIMLYFGVAKELLHFFTFTRDVFQILVLLLMDRPLKIRSFHCGVIRDFTLLMECCSPNHVLVGEGCQFARLQPPLATSSHMRHNSSS